MLRLVEPYVAWGYPNLKSVRELIYKRGYGKVWLETLSLFALLLKLLPLPSCDILLMEPCHGSWNLCVRCRSTRTGSR